VKFVVVGGGIVGLATAWRLTRQHPSAAVTVLEKERSWATHQTAHNSGVIHAGVYYRPGSLKALLCKAGGLSMIEFCRAHGVRLNVCGKLLVATSSDEIPRLYALYERALANGLPIRMISPEEARDHEPEVSCAAAAHVSSTGVVDYADVCAVLVQLLGEAGATLRSGSAATGIHVSSQRVTVETTQGDVTADALINCAGLHADRVAKMAGIDPPVRIVPFRGEYYELRPGARHLVRGLIYPVPDPRFPFLGVHLTRGVDGGVHAGPNAVMAFAREGYRWRDVSLRDSLETLAYPGLWSLGRRYFRYGLTEMRRSLSKGQFAASVARLVPAIGRDDLVRAQAGVRAQAVTPRGDLVDDFLVVARRRQVHVLNAPSPAATSAFEIARLIAGQLNGSPSKV
jgi:L-2-hydroxyglutarate oxidase